MTSKNQVSVSTLELKINDLQKLLGEIKRGGDPYLDEIQCQQAEKVAREISLLTKPARFIGYEMAMMVSMASTRVWSRR